MTSTIANVLIVLATLIGPIAAVQAQKWIERARESRTQKLKIFHTLMATRALRAASLEHVQALNSIDLFFSRNSVRERKVIVAWEEYLDHLNRFPQAEDAPAQIAWNERGTDFLAHLLKTIGDSLGYEFTIVQLKRGIYYPRGHDEDIAARIGLRKIITELAQGNRNIPLDIKSFPVDPKAFQLQTDVYAALLSALSGSGAVNVLLKTGLPTHSEK
jgi:hypothetical protein